MLMRSHWRMWCHTQWLQLWPTSFCRFQEVPPCKHPEYNRQSNHTSHGGNTGFSSPFQCKFFSFALLYNNCTCTWMGGNFGFKLEKSPQNALHTCWDYIILQLRTFKLTLSLTQPHSQGLSSYRPWGERGETLAHAGHVPLCQLKTSGRGPL